MMFVVILSFLFFVCITAQSAPKTIEQKITDFSGDGSGEHSEPIASTDIEVPLLEEELEGERILWRDVLGNIRQSRLEEIDMETITSYMNTKGLPEEFRRLTNEYLSGMIMLIKNRMGMIHASPHIYECTQSIPERFYAINLEAFDNLRHCPNCNFADIGVAYVNAVHDLVLDLFKCFDKDQDIRPRDSSRKK